MRLSWWRKARGKNTSRKRNCPRTLPATSNPATSASYCRDRIKDHFSSRGLELNLKYIDPSYLIRSLAANYNDRIYCGFLGQNAVHAGMAGKSGLLISRWRSHFVHIPIKAAVGKHKEVDLDSPLWRSVLESTGQPPLKNP